MNIARKIKAVQDAAWENPWMDDGIDRMSLASCALPGGWAVALSLNK